MNWGQFAGGAAQGITRGLDAAQRYQALRENQYQQETRRLADEAMAGTGASEVIPTAPEGRAMPAPNIERGQGGGVLGGETSPPQIEKGSGGVSDLPDQIHDMAVSVSDSMQAVQRGEKPGAIPAGKKRLAKREDWQRFNAAADIYLRRGRPEVAQQYRAMADKARIEGARKYGTMAVFALKNGDIEGANNALQRANAFNENGFDVTLTEEGGKVVGKYYDEKTGKLLGSREVTPEALEDYVYSYTDPAAYQKLRGQQRLQERSIKAEEEADARRQGYYETNLRAQTAEQLKIMKEKNGYDIGLLDRRMGHEMDQLDARLDFYEQEGRLDRRSRESMADEGNLSAEKIAGWRVKSAEKIAKWDADMRKSVAGMKAKTEQEKAIQKRYEKVQGEVTDMLKNLDGGWAEERYGRNIYDPDSAIDIGHVATTASMISALNPEFNGQQAVAAAFGVLAKRDAPGAFPIEKLNDGGEGGMPYIDDGAVRIMLPRFTKKIIAEWKKEAAEKQGPGIPMPDATPNPWQRPPVGSGDPVLPTQTPSAGYVPSDPSAPGAPTRRGGGAQRPPGFGLGYGQQ